MATAAAATVERAAQAAEGEKKGGMSSPNEKISVHIDDKSE